MPYKCAALSCKTGYNKHASPGITLHSFPKDQNLRKRWLENLSRGGFSPSQYSKVCSKHFAPECFVTERLDSNRSRLQRKSLTLSKRRLKYNAVPTIFDDDFSFTCTSQHDNHDFFSSASYLTQPDDVIYNEPAEDSPHDYVTSVEEIYYKLEHCGHDACKNFIFRMYDNSCFLFLMDYSPSHPSLLASAVILCDLNVKVQINGIPISATSYKHIVDKTIDSFSQVLNLLSFIKSDVYDNVSIVSNATFLD